MGGLALSVDLSRAFDSLPFWLLKQSLERAGVPTPLVELILSFHAQVRFRLANGAVSVTAGRGIREVCPLAPQLWAVASGCLIEMISARTSEDFCQQGLNLYADDNLGSWVFTRLSAVLRDHRALSVKDRVRLWKGLVQPVLLYGLAAVGVTTDILKDLTGLVAKQIRVIGRCHSYYTRETNDQVFDKLSVELPGLTLLRAAEQCVRQSENLIALQPPRVLEWQQTVYSTLQQSDMTASTETASPARLMSLTLL